MDLHHIRAGSRLAKYHHKNKFQIILSKLKGRVPFMPFMLKLKVGISFGMSQIIILFVLLLTVANVDAEIAQSTSNNEAESPRILTLRGKVDPRLSVWARTTYSPTNYRTDIDDGSGCTHNRSDTGYRKAWPDWEVVKITPNEQNRYEVTIPIDYMGENKCGYRYHSTEISIRRDDEDERYAKIAIVSDNPRPFNTYIGSKGGSSGLGRLIAGVNTDKAHYQMATGSKIVCYTKHYDVFKRLKDGDEITTFACEPVVASDVNGVDVINSVSLDIDIEIDESRCIGIPDHKIGDAWIPYQDYYRDYQAKPTRWEQFKQFLTNNIINKEESND